MNKYLFVIIVVTGLALRLYRINLPLLEFYPSRQIQTADITRNFFKTDFNILRPTVSYFGAGNTPFLIEFPAYNYLVALLYLVFGVHEVIGRLVSVLAWLVSLIFIYKIALKLGTKTIANIACLFYTLSPLSVLISRSFQPDQLMLTSSLVGVYSLLIYDGKKHFYFYLSAIFISLSILIKLPALIYTIIPVCYLIFKSKKDILKINNFFYLIIIILPLVSWYLNVYFRNQYGIQSSNLFSLSNWFGFDIFLNPNYYSNNFGFEYNLVLLPIGIIFFVVGIFQKLNANQKFLYYWLAGVILYFLILNKHNMTHEYYHLPLLPIASIFIGLGTKNIIDNIKNLTIPKSLLFLIVSVIIFLMMFITTKQRAYTPIDRFKFVPEVGKAIQRLTKPNDLVVGAMDAGPALVYYSNRAGWSFEINRDDVFQLYSFYGVKNIKILSPEEDLELYREKGAKIFAAGNFEQFKNNPSFADYMYKNYLVLEKSDDYIIFDLKNKI